MGRGLTNKIITRQRRILEFIESEICVNTKQIITEFNLTHSQAFYVLQMLQKQGVIEGHLVGKLTIWCIAGHMLNDVYVGNTFISIFDLEHAICRILENVKGHKATIRVSWVVDKIAEKVRVNPRQPLLLTYISEMLPILLSGVEKSTFKNAKSIEFFVVDTCSMCSHFNECPACEKLRKKLKC